MDINSRDVLFAIFRYLYAKQTLRIARRVSDQGARIILLTDSEFSPLVDLAHIQIVGASEGFPIFQSCTAVTAVLETLNIAVLRFCDKTIYNRLENAEKLFSARPKTVIFPNLYVPAERDLHFASTDSNYNPRNTTMYGCLSRCI